MSCSTLAWRYAIRTLKKISHCLRLFTAHGMLMAMKRWWPENSLPISEYQTKECWISIYSKLVTNKHTVLPVCCSQDRFLIIKKSGTICHLQLFESIFYLSCGDPGPWWQSKSGSGWTGCWFSSRRGFATRVNEMDCREGGVRKKKKRRWRSMFELKPPGGRFFLPRFSHSTFQSEKKASALPLSTMDNIH